MADNEFMNSVEKTAGEVKDAAQETADQIKSAAQGAVSNVKEETVQAQADVEKVRREAAAQRQQFSQQTASQPNPQPMNPQQFSQPANPQFTQQAIPQQNPQQMHQQAAYQQQASYQQKIPYQQPYQAGTHQPNRAQQDFRSQQGSYGYDPSTGQPNLKPGNTLAMIGMICGIASLLFCCVGPLAILLGIAAVICSAFAHKKGESKGMWMTGLITGIIGIVLGIVMTILLISVFLYAGRYFGQNSSVFSQWSSGTNPFDSFSNR